MFKVNIEKWIDKEIHASELALLKAQDELLQAQLRVKGFEARVARLKGQQKKRFNAAEDKRIERSPDWKRARVEAITASADAAVSAINNARRKRGAA